MDHASHVIEHQISALYDVTHGEGLAMILPALFRYYLPFAPERFAKFARMVFDVKKTDTVRAGELGIDEMEVFFRELGMPVCLSERQIDALRFEEMADTVMRTFPVLGSIVKFDRQKVLDVLAQSL